MRTFIIGLSLFMLGLSPSLAAGPCTEITTSMMRNDPNYTAGYVPVLVMVEMPATPGKAEAEAAKGFVRFAIMANAKNLRPVDEHREIDTMHQCSFVNTIGATVQRTDKILLRVRMLVDEKLTGDKSYTLHSGIYLPKTLVAKRPYAETELESGEVLQGHWDTVSISKDVQHVAVVKKGKKKGTRTVVTEKKTFVLTRLILRPKA